MSISMDEWGDRKVEKPHNIASSCLLSRGVSVWEVEASRLRSEASEKSVATCPFSTSAEKRLPCPGIAKGKCCAQRRDSSDG